MPDSATLYDKDWYAWTQDQAARLRDMPASQRPNGLDVENLAEEVEDMGKSQRRAVESLLLQLYLHLLKLDFHPATEARRGWRREVAAFRNRLDIEFRDSPSLRARREDLAGDAWRAALRTFREELAEDAPDHVGRFDACAPVESEPAYALDEEALRFGWFPAPRD